MQIKVTDTRMHKIIEKKTSYLNGQTIDYGSNVSVANAELVLVECKSEEALLFRYQNTETIHLLPKKRMLIKGLVDYLKPILISKTEKTIQGELCYSPTQKHIGINADSWEDTNQRILAFPEHFSPKHLQAIVDGKLKEGKVLVECEEHFFNKDNVELMWNVDGLVDKTKTFSSIKLNSSNHITLRKDEKNMYTKEEFLQGLLKFSNKDFKHLKEESLKYTIEEIKGWFEQNIK